MCLIKLDEWNCCTHDTCPYNRECAQHETAGDFRSEDGFSPILANRDGEIYCSTMKVPPIPGQWEVYPPERAIVGSGFIPFSKIPLYAQDYSI